MSPDVDVCADGLVCYYQQSKVVLAKLTELRDTNLVHHKNWINECATCFCSKSHTGFGLT